MGGMAAEEIFFGEPGTGPAGDLAYATRLAAQMVGSYGMAGSLISLDASRAPGDIVSKVLSDERQPAGRGDFPTSAHDGARDILLDKRHVVEAFRDALGARRADRGRNSRCDQGFVGGPAGPRPRGRAHPGRGPGHRRPPRRRRGQSPGAGQTETPPSGPQAVALEEVGQDSDLLFSMRGGEGDPEPGTARGDGRGPYGRHENALVQ